MRGDHPQDYETMVAIWLNKFPTKPQRWNSHKDALKPADKHQQSASK